MRRRSLSDAAWPAAPSLETGPPVQATPSPARKQLDGPPPVERLTYRLADIAKALGISRRALERERSAGRLPRPDLTLGRMPLWRVETIRRWVEGGGRL
jgi:hypothetical protein